MVKVLKKVDAILGIVAEKKDKAALVEISRRLKIHKATLSHILKTLHALGYVQRDTDRCYSIGPRIIELAESSRRQTILQEVAEEQVQSLADELREMAIASVIRDGDRYRLARASVDQSVTVSASIEMVVSPYKTATGRLSLSYLDREGLSQVLKKHGLPGCLWKGISRRKALDIELAEIRARRLAFWRAEDGHAEGAAVPVYGPDKTVWAALGVGLPALRFRGARREQIIRTLKAAGEQMSYNLALRYGKLVLPANATKEHE